MSGAVDRGWKGAEPPARSKDRERVEAILRERGFTLEAGDVDALVELAGVFRALEDRLREVALRQGGPAPAADA